MNRRGSPRRPGVALLATAACGSTVQSGGGTAFGGAETLTPDGSAAVGGDGLGGEGMGGEDLTGDGLAPSAGGGTGAAFGGGAGETTGAFGGGSTASGGSAGGALTTSGGGPTSSGFGTGTTGDAAGSEVVHGPGVTDKTIALGIPYCTDCSSANAALGAGGEDPGDQRRYMQAALDDVNARGGVLGRKLVPVFHAISASDNIDTSAQAMCETWTKDNKVLSMFMRGKIIYQCAKKAGAIVSGGGPAGRSSTATRTCSLLRASVSSASVR